MYSGNFIKETKVSADIGNYNRKNFTFIHNQPLSSELYLRWALARNNDDGFIYNDFFRKYRNNRDEVISNLKLLRNKSLGSGDLVNVLYTNLNSNMDNGNDRWSPTNFDNLTQTF